MSPDGEVPVLNAVSLMGIDHTDDYRNALLSALLEKLNLFDKNSNSDPVAVKNLISSATNIMKHANIADIRPNSGLKSLPDIIIELLDSTSEELALNAAGALGSLAGTEDGRRWLISSISQPLKMLNSINRLLSSTNEWIASNAALVIARFSISNDGIRLILNSSLRLSILQKLVYLLGQNNSGSGINAAFAIGRICETKDGQSYLFDNCDLDKLSYSLREMFNVCASSNDDMAIFKNACFCLTSIVSKPAGNIWASENSTLLYGGQLHMDACQKSTSQQKINTSRYGCLYLILHALQSADREAAWFSSVVLRTFIGFAAGYKVVYQYKNAVEFLKVCLFQPDLRKSVSRISW